MLKIRAWTQAYRPFIMGGNVNAPIACEIACTPALKVIAGVYVHGIISPRGNTFFVESRSGGIVGNDMDVIRQDAKSVSLEELELQITEQVEVGKTATPVTEHEFWKLMRELAE